MNCCSTGKLEFLEKLKKEVPPGLVEWLPIPGLGPKRAAMIWKTLNITTFAELEAAAKEGKLRDLPGMGAKIGSRDHRRDRIAFAADGRRDSAGACLPRGRWNR